MRSCDAFLSGTTFSLFGIGVSQASGLNAGKIAAIEGYITNTYGV
jgi:hypothetical protein